MKKIYLLIALVISSIVLSHAQSNNGISYQGFFSNYEFTGDQTLRITLLKDSGNGQNIYMEETIVKVEKGHFSLIIGHGQSQGAYNFKNIEWGSYNAVFCKVEWVRSFSNVKLLSLSQLMSVPFAFHAQKADSVLYAHKADSVLFAHKADSVLYSQKAFYAENSGRMIDTIITINSISSWPLHIDIPQMDFMPSKMHLTYSLFFVGDGWTLNGTLKYYDSKRDGNVLIMDRYFHDHTSHRANVESTRPTTEKLLEADGLNIPFDVKVGQIIFPYFPSGTDVNLSGLKLYIVAEY